MQDERGKRTNISGVDLDNYPNIVSYYWYSTEMLLIVGPVMDNYKLLVSMCS